MASGRKRRTRRILSGLLAVLMLASDMAFCLPAGASDIWPQKDTAPFYCMDGGKAWRISDRYEEVGRREAGISDVQARRLFWAYPDIWNGLLKPAAARYDPDLYEKIRNTVSDPNVVKRVKDSGDTMFAWVADHPEIEERARAAVVKYAAEKAEAGRTPPAALFNQETGTYAVYENAAVRISVGDFGPGSASGTDFETDPYFISQIRSIEPQTVYDNGSSGGTAGWIDASQDRNIAESLLGTKLYEISWSGSSLHIINNGSRYANETVLDSGVPDEVKYNKTIVRFRITMKEGSGYVLDASWNENYLDEWMRFKVCVNAPDRQRLYLAHAPIEPSSMPFYLEISQNGVPAQPQPGGGFTEIPFRIYRHEETFEADYHVRMRKLDAETGMPVKGSQFYLYERFDSRNMLADSQKDGGLTEENLNFTPWEGFRIFGDSVTDSRGEISHGDHREYRYDKTYCNGHPAPVWTEIPGEEINGDTGETENEAEIEAALDANRSAAAEWLHLADSCRTEAEQSDAHFHWLAEETLYGSAKEALESGRPGNTGNADVSAETAFEKSGCREDCEKTYRNFINLEFSYTWKEIQAAVGYILHGVHPEDIPIEIITTNSSQAGAESRFGNGYSTDITENVWYSGGGAGAGEREERKNRLHLYEGDPRPALGITPDPQRDDGEELKFFTEEPLDLFTFLQNRQYMQGSRKPKASSSNGEKVPESGNSGTGKLPAASGSNCEKLPAATDSDAEKENGFQSLPAGRMRLSPASGSEIRYDGWEDGTEGTDSFYSYLNGAGSDGIRHLDTGDASGFSHCSGKDDCGDSWRIYDHRTEGRVHINKRDLELYRKEDEAYSSYGDSQGDGTLEGAVYGLFAAEDILHPDSGLNEDGTIKNTGIVYRRHDLTAVAATDKDGNADFLVYTEAPGSYYDYEKGMICRRDGNGPANLFQSDGFLEEIDSYSADDTGGLKYRNNEELNGNQWIGRPLILGKYYVKELSRSEGYELSVNGILGQDTNFGAGLETPDSAVSSGGSAVLTVPELSASMEGPDGSGNGYDQLTVTVTSSDTAGNSGEDGGYDLIFSGFPEDTFFYRTDSGEEEVTGPRVTGLEDAIVRDENGRIVWKRAESDESDLKYEPVFDNSGNLEGQKAAVRSEEQVMKVERTALAERRMPEYVEFDREGLSDLLSSGMDGDGQSPMFLTIKARLEEILRQYDYDTPRNADGKYSTEEYPAFSRGLRKGETDVFGQTGPAGEPAASDVYGEAVAVLVIEKMPDQATAGDLVAAMLSWYGKNPWWSFGGLDKIEKNGQEYRICLYAGNRSAYGRNFFTMNDADGNAEADSIYVAYEDPQSLRVVYQKYAAEGEFSFEVQRKYSFGSGTMKRYYVDASVRPVLQDDGSGTLKKVYHPVMVFHKKGEEIIDYEKGDPGNGYRVPLTEQKEKIEIITAMETVQKDVKLDAEYDPDTGTHIIHVKTSGTDSFGKEFTDENGSLKLSFTAVTRKKKVRLSAGDIAELGTANAAGYKEGDELGFVQYLMIFSGASVGAVCSPGKETEAGNTYIVTKRLIYRGQNKVSEDGDTGLRPVQVLERPIRQKIKVIKKIEREEDGTYPFHTGQIHEDAFTSEFGGKGEPAAGAMPNFRFRLYLKSNLERLYKNQEGEMFWTDRNGIPVDPEVFRKEFPELVQKLYTKSGDGYIRLLETQETAEEGGSRRKIQYNYEKFFDAVETADKDKWRNTGEVQNSSFRPTGVSRLTGAVNTVNTSPEAEENARKSDAVRQFAVKWYLEDESEKLLITDENGELQAREGPVRYGDQLYDRALNQAIRKAEEYLKPFFSWDIRNICAIPWDTSPDGGADQDMTTLAADFLMEENGEPVYSYGISGMLPYGDYVLVEQQPWNSRWRDFPNRHYAADRPREISLPAICESGYAGEEELPEAVTSFYRYRASDSPEQLAAGYLIRFNEEMSENHRDDERSYVIRAHNADGDFEVYKYGLTPSQAEGHYEPYGNPAVAGYYHYASDSETAGDKDGTRTMTGVRTAVDGMFAPMLIPWSMTEPQDRKEDGSVDPSENGPFTGYAYRPVKNRFYSVKLRIEKLDGETGEQILHDDAVFALYAAEREDAPDGDGSVRRYGEPTLITGSRIFLEAMGAERITPLAREWDSAGGPGDTCYGIVPAGTPICREKEMIILEDDSGLRTGKTGVLMTERDEMMKAEDGDSMETGFQTTGYATTPQPIGAGAYVLAELKAPDGYVKSRPIAVEIYSDQISYFPDGGKQKTAALVFSDGGSGTARLYVENVSVRVLAEKEKTPDIVRKMKISGRVEGSLSELDRKYGAENLEFAFSSTGKYLGYGWFRGTLEYLENRKKSGDAVEIVYGSQQIFSGYGYLSGEPDTAGDRNRHVPGAVMGLYRALEIRETGDSGDCSFEGVHVERDRTGKVTEITVRAENAGASPALIQENGVWKWKIISSEDTPVLFFDLGNLNVTETGTDGTVYGYDRKGKKIQILPDTGSIYALRDGIPVFEIQGEHIRDVVYDRKNGVFPDVPEGVVIYHLDENGRRDAMTDGYTGLAYVESGRKKFAWPVTVSQNQEGTAVFREKILTGRPAEANADTELAYITGSMQENRFEKMLEPVYEIHGLPDYYRISAWKYVKGWPVHDRDGKYVRYRYHDLLEMYNQASYRKNEKERLEDVGDPRKENDGPPLWHRLGEACLIPNIWKTGEKEPNSPEDSEMTRGQPDLLKRVRPGTYILEEIAVPDGYVRAFPEAVTVAETEEIQTVSVINEKTRIEILKTDGTDRYETSVINRDDPAEGTRISVSGKGDYTHTPVQGSVLALFRAERIAGDPAVYPEGWYLRKSEETPAVWYTEDPEDNRPVPVTAKWTTGETPVYFEGIPAGDYILEELSAPAGLVRNSMGITVEQTEELQTFVLKNDHTKLEILKFQRGENGEKIPLPEDCPAELTLYPAVLDQEGRPILENGVPAADISRIIDRWETGTVSGYMKEYIIPEKNWSERLLALFTGREVSGFTHDFENYFLTYGTGFDGFFWTEIRDGMPQERSAQRLSNAATGKGETVVQLWCLDDGTRVRITVCRTSITGKPVFEYRFDYKETEDGTVSYSTEDGCRRLERIPAGYYVLMETGTPPGYQTAAPKLIQVCETGSVWRYEVENRRNEIWISKTNESGQSLEGAEMVLYRAAEDGSLVMEQDYEEDRWISGKEGRFTSDDIAMNRAPEGMSAGDLKPHRLTALPPGVYYLAELKAPEGFIPMEPMKLDIGMDSSLLIQAPNRMAQGRILLKKEDGETEVPLEGAIFEAENMDTGETTCLITDADGNAESGLLPVGRYKDGKVNWYRYRVKEVRSPAGYRLNPESWEFSFGGEITGQELRYHIAAENRKTEVVFCKTDFYTGSFAAGAHLAVYEAEWVNGQYVKKEPAAASWISDGGPHTVRGLTAGGIYILEETQAPAGYKKNGPVLFAVSGDGQRILWSSDAFQMIRYEEADGAQGTGSVLILGRSAGRTEMQLYKDGEEICSWYGSGSGKRFSAEELENGGIYVLKETAVYSDGSRRPVRAGIFRTGFSEGEIRIQDRLFQSVMLTLKDGKGNVLDSWETDGEERFHRITESENGEEGKRFRTGERYMLEEMCCFWTEGKMESVLTGRFSFTLDENRNVTSIELENRPTEIKIRKTRAGTGNLLPGAELVLKGPGGITVDRWTSQEEPHVLTGKLLTGERYVLEEEISPPGYGRAEPISFILPEDVLETEVNMEDYPTRAEIRKTDIATGEELEGAELTLRDSSGNIVERWISEKEPHVISGKLLAGETYTLEETGPPSGYAYSEAVTFTMPEDGTIVKVEMKDRPTRTEILKTDMETGKPLPGAELELYDTDGKAIARWTSGEEPYILTGVLKAGKTYWISEIQPPGGYGRTMPVKFKVSLDGTADCVSVQNKKTEIEILKTDAGNGKPLAGARLRLTDSQGKTAAEWITEAEPYILKGILVSGEEYVLTEVRPPAGYKTAEEIRFRVPDTGERIRIAMEDQKIPADRDDGGEEPDPEPEKEKKKQHGIITAEYSHENRIQTVIDLREQPGGGIRIPPTGDHSKTEVFVWILLMGAAGLIWQFRRWRKGGS